MLVLDELVIVSQSTGLAAVDAHTGEVWWSADPVARQGWGMVSDGQHLLTVERENEGPTMLVCRELLTGRTVWTEPAPAQGPVQSMGVRALPDGTVLLASDDQLTALT